MARKKLNKPAPLQPGDVVRVTAPSSPLKDADRLAAGVALLESWGLVVRMQDGLNNRRHLYFAGRPEERAAELMAALLDPQAKAVLSVRGGYGITTLLPLLDAAAVAAAPPKIVVGCSDLTALLTWLVQDVGQTCFHGPMLGALGDGRDEAGAARLRTMLFEGGKPRSLKPVQGDEHACCVSPGVATGRAVGGSLSLLAAQTGTPWQVDARGAVLFLEDVGERPYRIDRMLVQLAQAGLFEQAAGVVLGDFTGCEEPGGKVTWRDAVDRIFRRLPIPVLAGVQFGHGNPNLAWPLGVRVQLDAGAGLVSFREAPLA
jgi:muramoyltetrapeptide carboxypeptidase